MILAPMDVGAPMERLEVHQAVGVGSASKSKTTRRPIPRWVYMMRHAFGNRARHSGHRMR